MAIHNDLELLVPKKDVDEAFATGIWLGMIIAMIGFGSGIALGKLLFGW
jgi:hypothetical protein